MGTADAKKDAWIDAAAEILHSHMPDCARNYAESLYQTYVVEDGDHWTARAAVSEDMNYWED